MQPMYIVILVAALLVTGFIAFILGFFYRKSVSEKQIGSAQEEARRIINEAIKTANTKKIITSKKLTLTAEATPLESLFSSRLTPGSAIYASKKPSRNGKIRGKMYFPVKNKNPPTASR